MSNVRRIAAMRILRAQLDFQFALLRTMPSPEDVEGQENKIYFERLQMEKRTKGEAELQAALAGIMAEEPSEEPKPVSQASKVILKPLKVQSSDEALLARIQLVLQARPDKEFRCYEFRSSKDDDTAHAIRRLCKAGKLHVIREERYHNDGGQSRKVYGLGRAKISNTDAALKELGFDVIKPGFNPFRPDPVDKFEPAEPPKKIELTDAMPTIRVIAEPFTRADVAVQFKVKTASVHGLVSKLQQLGWIKSAGYRTVGTNTYQCYGRSETFPKE